MRKKEIYKYFFEGKFSTIHNAIINLHSAISLHKLKWRFRGEVEHSFHATSFLSSSSINRIKFLFIAIDVFSIHTNKSFYDIFSSLSNFQYFTIKSWVIFPLSHSSDLVWVFSGVSRKFMFNIFLASEIVLNGNRDAYVSNIYMSYHGR